MWQATTTTNHRVPVSTQQGGRKEPRPSRWSFDSAHMPRGACVPGFTHISLCLFLFLSLSLYTPHTHTHTNNKSKCKHDAPMRTRDGTVKSGRPTYKCSSLTLARQDLGGRGQRAVAVLATLSLTLELSAMIICLPRKTVLCHADREAPSLCLPHAAVSSLSVLSARPGLTEL